MSEPSFFDIAQDMLCVATPEGRFRRVNDSWTRTLGWSREELCAKPFVEFVHPDDRDRTATESRGVATGRPTFHFRNRYRSKSGGWHWVDWKSVLDEESGEIYASARDVTREVVLHERLAAREALLTTMVAQQLHAREDEHRRIAVKLHDSALQHSVAALMFLDLVPLDDPAVREPVDLVRGEVNLALETTRLVMQGLDPLDLGEQGVAAAIASTAEELAARFGLRIDLEVDDVCVSAPIATSLCRMVRETLINAAKHAHASRVVVSIGSDELDAWAEVRDDGRGMDVVDGGTSSRSGAGLGLAFLRERAASLGGVLHVTSCPEGTCVRMVIPSLSPDAIAGGRE